MYRRPTPPPHPATVLQREAPHPATVLQRKAPHPAKVAAPRGAPAGAVQRMEIVEVRGSPTCRFHVNVKGGKLTDFSQTTHALHTYVTPRGERRYSVNTWTNDDGALITSIQRGFRKIYDGTPNFFRLLAEHDIRKSGGLIDMVLKHYVLESGYAPDWFKSTDFTLDLTVPVGAAPSPTDQENLAVHLVYLRVSFHYREKAMNHFGATFNYLSCIAQMNQIMFQEPWSLKDALRSASGGHQGTIERLTALPLEDLYEIMRNVPQTKTDSGLLWNVLVAYVANAELDSKGGFPESKADLNHLRFRLYEEWRAIYELSLAIGDPQSRLFL
ncbi:hypothetical protein [Polyangium spumosum]|uniref:Uncharacterized protein n=1 Tax=Polyangium spumosum TaxID=889282 RepID=A0A6N7Q625_9BACT|nr:hypothetical protein [Polyangium spumosum]MRG98350.1 hypothetical protein [Polyangium spumosum]